MSTIGFVAVVVLVLVVIGLGASGTLSAVETGYHKLMSNALVQKIESEASAKLVALHPTVQKLVNEATGKGI